MHIEADTLDDMLRVVFQRLLRSRNRPSPTKGANREEIGALLTIRKPRARFSRTEQRATLFSCLGETLWYLSGSDRLEIIEYYIRGYREFSKLPKEATSAPGAYGPRLFGAADQENQVSKIIQMLRDPQKHDTRQAVIQIFDSHDVGKLDVPCTCNIQFFARGKLLHCYVSMRSNDAYLGLVRAIHNEIGQNPTEVFDYMYRSMDAVMRFGRLGRFDFLTMLEKLGIAPIEPGSAYLWHNASGPLAGTKLLFLGNENAKFSARKLDTRLEDLDKHLKVGMQTLEDALCNWQKSPGKFISFRG